MSAPDIVIFVAVYVVGGLASFFINMLECDDGYLLSARILLWPLFVVKAAIIMVKVAADDLLGLQQ